MTRKDYVFLAELTMEIIVAHTPKVENADSLVDTVVNKIDCTPGTSGFNEYTWRTHLIKELRQHFSEAEAKKIGYHE